MAKGKGFIAEFKKFIMRGNVIDLAVGVIIGGAFQSIVKSLVDDIFMPIISLATKGIDFFDQMTLANPADGRIAAHLPQCFNIVGQK